ncbi:type I-E CRISPR-associated protein Cas7/Cse4/CasC [Sulfidibacter corallicola]|uniref:Type I-E CRISPR-associated protein Cas7/Cse4/CasC n=1 Tax=Sulfidibacter corallicola TaxID=2818388 RepID=A0A8A4TJC7_SULCO|nr:type I-E CRISPR-associated protein Cas7/Cse4/CasC [Sulfidibacter corallicola]QTD49304.1 type I-E CRISPR-associated protein Cas7/Cse4/CasC [Sulfidibacter corallicola]
MSRFTQLHVLTFYPPSNLNRDDLGRPKTAQVGGTNRLRISSQCLKRAWRTSDLFQEALAGHLGVRTRKIATSWVMPILEEQGIDEKKAKEWAQHFTKTFSNIKKGDLDTPQLVHYSPEEKAAVLALARTCAEQKRPPTDDELHALRGAPHAADIAMFGRMLADHPSQNCEAAVQVAHAISVNKVAVEDDFFTAVDDLNRREDTGAGHLDELGFGSGLYYLYVNINRDQLVSNLGDDADLASHSLRALVASIAKVSPGGKQNSFAALGLASYILAEHEDQSPRSLAMAFIKDIRDSDQSNILANAVDAMRTMRSNLADCYEVGAGRAMEFYPAAGEGRFGELLDFVSEG